VVVVDVVAVILLITLLVLHELVRAARGPRAEVRMRTLKVVIVPLGLVFVVIVVQRLAQLLLR
jgi:hypothetical protein